MENNNLKNEQQCAIHDVMHSVLDDYCKERFTSWLEWYKGDISKAFDKLKLIVKIQINLCEWYEQPRKEIFERNRDVLCELEQHCA